MELLFLYDDAEDDDDNDDDGCVCVRVLSLLSCDLML